MQTTSSSVSTTSERMALVLEHIVEDLDAPLLTHTQNMLAEIGITAGEGNVVCSTFRMYPLYITVGLCFDVSLAVLRSLYPGVGQGWASLSNSLGSQLLTQSMGWRSEMLNRRLGFSKSAKD